MNVKQVKILVVECNQTGEWWAFKKLDTLIEHFHFYYKTTKVFNKNNNEILQSDIISDLKEFGETELHTKRDKETFLYVRMTQFK